MKRWVRRQADEAREEREEAAASADSLKALIHDVADVVIQLRVATEDLERALTELARHEGGEGD